MTSDSRVGRGPQRNKKSNVIGWKLTDTVGKGVKNHQKSSGVIYGRSQTWVGNFTPCPPVSFVPECSSMHLSYTVKAYFECSFYITYFHHNRHEIASLFDIYLLFYLVFYNFKKKPSTIMAVRIIATKCASAFCLTTQNCMIFISDMIWLMEWRLECSQNSSW